MEGTESTTRERTKDGNQEADQMMLMNNKPLHRFVQKEPRSLGIVIVIFGCTELLMGFQLASESGGTSYGIYIPFWQGVLFLVCGTLSIYTELHPSKKMVTICLAMYVVSLMGIIVSIVYRIQCFPKYTYLRYWTKFGEFHSVLLFGVEGLLLASSLCVSALLIFLSVIARFALKSTHTQIIVQHIPAPQSDTTSN